jgi:hypothetical protein
VTLPVLAESSQDRSFSCVKLRQMGGGHEKTRKGWRLRALGGAAGALVLEAEGISSSLRPQAICPHAGRKDMSRLLI